MGEIAPCLGLRPMSGNPRIVFVGWLSEGGKGRSRSQQRFEALQALPYDARGLSLEDGLSAAGVPVKRSLVSRVRLRLGVPADETELNAQLLALAAEWPFDMLWLDKAITVWPWTVWRLRRMLPKLRVGAWIEEYVRPPLNRTVFMGATMPLVDAAFTPRSQNLGARWLERHRPRRLVLVDETYDPDIHAPWIDADGAPARLTTDVAFIGSFERDRAEDMLYLAEHGVRVSIWGNGWERFGRSHEHLTIHGHAVIGRDYARTLSQARINLCFLRKANLDQQTNRTMEIPACGAFMLAERTPEHMRLFAEGTEAAYFSGREEMLQQVRHYLGHEPERAAIAEAGYRKVTGGGFSHADRMAYMLDVLRRPQAATGA